MKQFVYFPSEKVGVPSFKKQIYFLTHIKKYAITNCRDRRPSVIRIYFNRKLQKRHPKRLIPIRKFDFLVGTGVLDGPLSHNCITENKD